MTHINPEAACRRNFHIESKATSAFNISQASTLVPETRVKIREKSDFVDRGAATKTAPSLDS